MHIKFIPRENREARLANIRLRLMRSCSGRAPDENMDLIFHQGHGEVFGFTLRETYGYEKLVFTADRAKVEEETKACGFKTKAEEHAWLDGIKKAESKLWQAWIDGDMYDIVVERYNESERRFFTVDCLYELYGWESVVENLKDMNLSDVEVFCVDPDLGDPTTWKDEFREFDI